MNSSKSFDYIPVLGLRENRFAPTAPSRDFLDLGVFGPVNFDKGSGAEYRRKADLLTGQGYRDPMEVAVSEAF